MEKNFELLEKYLIEFLKEEVYKVGINSVVVGLSGGIDSAVVAVLAKKAFDNSLLCVMMPSQFSSKDSISDAKELCEKFEIRYEIVSIESMLKAYINENMSNLRIGNLSARLRMAILYDISAREDALVVGTSNKSELLLGYGTLFGDLASALNPIGDIYKSEIFEFAKYLKVPESIIKKPPSADLWSGQKDEDDLGYTYDEIDQVLKKRVEERLSFDELLKEGYNEELCKLVEKKIFQNQFKRKTPIIAKITERTVGHDFLYPRDIRL